jgi:error-prone DNA polymerase
VLERTLGVPVFQEQLMQMGMAVGDLTGEDADVLRRAMGSKRGIERIESVRQKLYDGMARNGLVGAVADDIYAKIQAFANFGFAESHSLSFALLVYASSWLKLHYPGRSSRLSAGAADGVLLAGDPHRRRPPPRRRRASSRPARLRGGCRARALDARRRRRATQPATPPAPIVTSLPCPCSTSPLPTSRPPTVATPATPCGWGSRRSPGWRAARGAHRRHPRRRRAVPRPARPRAATGATAAQVEALATAGAFESMGISRREGIWLAGDAAQDLPEFLPDTLVAVQPPLFGDQSSYDVLAADLWATGISTDDHPLTHYRRRWMRAACSPARAAHARGRAPGRGRGSRHAPAAAGDGIRHHVHQPRRRARPRQRHLLEGVWDSYRRVLRDAPALIARGMLERSPEGVTNLVADAFEDLRVGVRHRSATSD